MLGALEHKVKIGSIYTFCVTRALGRVGRLWTCCHLKHYWWILTMPKGEHLNWEDLNRRLRRDRSCNAVCTSSGQLLIRNDCLLFSPLLNRGISIERVGISIKFAVFLTPYKHFTILVFDRGYFCRARTAIEIWIILFFWLNITVAH